jgi:2-oxoisovalerate dehydrogenase E1 component beta subunit
MLRYLRVLCLRDWLLDHTVAWRQYARVRRSLPLTVTFTPLQIGLPCASFATRGDRVWSSTIRKRTFSTENESSPSTTDVAPGPAVGDRAQRSTTPSLYPGGGDKLSGSVSNSAGVVKATEETLRQMNLFTAINSALSCALESNPKVLVFGEDVAFGGVFRCTSQLQKRFGRQRVFNTPLTEQGIVGFAAGLAAMGYRPVAEIQFADYIYPAFDQIVNEIAKYRYRSGGQFNCGGVVIRAPYGAVGHGGHYHSQSPEAYFLHTAGIKVVIPRDPFTAKGLLLQSIAEDDPVIFFEPKALYRAAQAEVPLSKYVLPLGRAEIVRPGTDITLVAYGAQVRVLLEAAQVVAREDKIEAEVIDIQTILPWDEVTVCESVARTGRCIVSHEAPLTGGVGAEVAARIQEECFLDLESPVMRICGYDMPFPLVHEKNYLPSAEKVVQCIRDCLNY